MKNLKKISYFVVYILLSLFFIEWSRSIDNDTPQNLWLLISFLLILKHRLLISNWFSRLKTSPIIGFLVVSIPFMLVEENINCLPSGCKLIPITIPFLLAHLLLVYYLIKRFKVKSFRKALIIFCALGVVWEITIGGSSGAFRALPAIWFVIIFAWTWMSYAYITVVPLTYLFEKRKDRQHINHSKNK